MLKSAALYLLMVGVPLLGLVAILHWGESIAPPPHVGGAWSIEAACSGVPPESGLVVDQSGRFLRAKFRDGIAGKGRLEGDRFTATVTATVGACSGQDLAIDARLEDERLVGTIQGPQCSACPASDFVAGREKAGD
jgi:hypothetical protein